MFEQEVNAGIEYLVETDGADFYKGIDIDKLSQGNARLCVLAQLDGDGFTPAYYRRCLTHKQTVEYGFMLPEHLLGVEQASLAWAKLTEVWQQKLTEMVEFQEAIDRVLSENDVEKAYSYEREMVHG